MGRGNGRNRKRNQQQQERNEPAVKQPRKEEVWRAHKQIPENTYFRRYYQLQFQPYFKDDADEFQRFWQSLKERLPVVFRVNCNQPNYRAFVRKLCSEELVKWEKLEGEFEPQQPIKVECVDWYPEQLVWSINTTKQQFKKSKLLKELHALVEKATDAGLVTRQELVSMMPPLFLDIKPTDLVMDMCAAPGSKTSQMLEMLYSHQTHMPTGGVIANDVEYSRAQMLIHQVQRSWTAGMAVINHNGQFLPQLYADGKKVLFDKVLADVPCSGDGATRKLPNKWSDWHSNDGAVLHPLQLNILMRGINLLKEDGLLLYSTCSMNPLEDEAVLLELMRRVKSGIQIVDIHDRGVKGRRGLNHWHILESKGKEISAAEMKAEGDELFNVYTEYVEGAMPPKLKKSMFPERLEVMQQFGIANSMRILPHDHNSGGFFVALLRKTKNFHWKYEDTLSKTADNKDELQEKALEAQMEKVDASELPKEAEQGDEQVPRPGLPEVNKEEAEQPKEAKIPRQPNPNQQNKRHVSKIVEEYVLLESEEYRSIQSFYGIESDLFRNNLFVKKNEECRKKVTLVTDGVSNYVRADNTGKLKLINMGCKAFEKGKESFAGNECLYRLCQDSIHFLLPLLTRRKVRVSLEDFRLLIQEVTVKHEQIANEVTRKQLQAISQGSFAVYIDEVLEGRQVVDALVAQNFRTALNIMVSKVDLESLRIRYC